MAGVAIPDRGGDTFLCVDLENGYRVPRFFKTPEEIVEIWKILPHFKFREDDIMLCSFPKTGTNWLSEIITMTIRQNAERVKMRKIEFTLEAVRPEPLADLPSPRILNTHIHYKYLPKDMKEKKVKTVLIMRNPKDTAVSYFNHMYALNLYNYFGKWENWLPAYIAGEVEYGTYESYLLEWEQAIKDQDLPIHVLYYEDLKQNGLEEIKRLAKFLGVDIDDEMCRDIEKMCNFDLMKKEKFPEDVKKIIFKENTEFYRKGQIGDWKNWFTVAQNEKFDELWNKRMKDSDLKFKYVLSLK